MLQKDFDKIAKQLDAVFDHADQTFKAMDKTFKTMEEYMDGVMSRIDHPWKKWFAWHPVKVNGKRVWMKTIYRRYNWAKSTDFPFGEGYDYGTIFDVLKDTNGR